MGRKKEGKAERGGIVFVDVSCVCIKMVVRESIILEGSEFCVFELGWHIVVI